MTFLERYLQGQHTAVWAELNELGDNVRSRKLRDDAYAVARETMRRARVNIEALIKRLPELGYKFHDKKPFVSPPRNTESQCKKLERILSGPLPMTLWAWWEQVGEVSLTGEHQALHTVNSDPIVFAPVSYALEAVADWAGHPATRAPAPPQPAGAWKGSVEAWRRSLRARDMAGDEIEALLAPSIAMFEAQDREYEKLRAMPADPRFRFDFAPDELHKAGISGATYDVLLPCAASDFTLEGAQGTPLFVDYLRQSFQYGGFRGWIGHEGPPHREIEFLTRDLLPL
ncbi:MAG: hypothetical protein HYX27_15880 [Acidobacteria bacterium]|nr:hypothetical protein [Acidobacteriota bacterium]